MGQPAVEVALPEAAPDLYLRWIAFFRQVEQAMLERPALEKLAAQESAPFLQDLMAAFISSSLAPQIVHQASAAKREGRSSVSPTLTGPPEVLRKAADYVSRRGTWLSQEGVLEAMEIDPPDPAVSELRAAVLLAVREALDRTTSGPSRGHAS